jgi:hypothetical protein
MPAKKEGPVRVRGLFCSKRFDIPLPLDDLLRFRTVRRSIATNHHHIAESLGGGTGTVRKKNTFF